MTVRDQDTVSDGTLVSGALPQIDWLPSPTLLIDAQGQCVAVSDSACGLLAIDREALLGGGWLQAFKGADDNIRWITSMAGLRDGTMSMDLMSSSKPHQSVRLEFKSVSGNANALFACLTDTTTERQAVVEGAHYKTLLDRIQNISNTGYWRYDVASGEVLWSDRVYEIHGMERGPGSVDIGRAIASYHPDDRQRVIDHMDHSLATGEPFEFELRLVRPNGEIRHVVSRGEVDSGTTKGAGRLFGVFQDVTVERQEAHATQVAQERLRMVVEASQDGLWDWDFGAEDIFMSARLKQILGITDPDSMINTDAVRSFIHPEDRKIFYKTVDRSFETGDRCETEVRILRKDGSQGWVGVKAVAAFDKDGNPSRVVCAVSDITKRRLAEEQLRQAQADAVESDKAKSTFVATVSHELRTPLNGIIGMLELLSDAKLNSDQQPLADIAGDSARGLLAILDDLLDLSKLGANRLELNPVAFKPYDAVQGVIHLFAPGAAQRDMGIFLDVDPRIPETIVADKVRLRQIISNLIGNALKFTDSGTINVHVKKIEGPRGQSQLHIAVQDTGIGIANDVQAKLFEPYTQATGSTFEEFGGTGLGLAICKQLAERMGGVIGVESQPGTGSTFWFTIDYAEDADGAAGVRIDDTVSETATTPDEVAGPQPEKPSVGIQLPGPVEATERSADKPHVLIAEDNAVNQRVITAMVARLGYTFDMVEDGAQAVEAARDTLYDAILMDIQMPNIDGVMATRLIREEERDLDRHVPIIAITAHAMRGTKEDYLAAGMSDFVPKPISVKALAIALHKHCQNKTNEAGEQKSTAFAQGSA